MLIGLRDFHHQQQTSFLEGWAFRLVSMVMQRPWLYRLALRMARLVLRPFACEGWLRRLPGPGGNWTQARDFPAPAARPFRDRWKELQ
jgi:L-lactate dehydrogenase complex protein LldF